MGQSSFVIHEDLRIFELQTQKVGEVRKHMRELRAVRRIGVQRGAVGRIGLGDDPLSILLQ